MMRELKSIEIMEDACQYAGVSLQEISCYLFDEGRLYIRGSIRAKEGYKRKGELQIRADVLNSEKKIIYSLEDYQRRSVDFLYDSFELSYYGTCDILQELDLEKCTIRVYPIIRSIRRRG